MDIDKYPPSLIEALAIHAFLFKLSYTGKEVSLRFGDNKDVLVHLCADGKMIYFRIWEAELPINEMGDLWKVLCKDWNDDMTGEERDEIFLSSCVYKQKIETATALLNAGFERWWSTSSKKEKALSENQSLTTVDGDLGVVYVTDQEAELFNSFGDPESYIVH